MYVVFMRLLGCFGALSDHRSKPQPVPKQSVRWWWATRSGVSVQNLANIQFELTLSVSSSSGLRAMKVHAIISPSAPQIVSSFCILDASASECKCPSVTAAPCLPSMTGDKVK